MSSEGSHLTLLDQPGNPSLPVMSQQTRTTVLASSFSQLLPLPSPFPPPPPPPPPPAAEDCSRTDSGRDDQLLFVLRGQAFRNASTAYNSNAHSASNAEPQLRTVAALHRDVLPALMRRGWSPTVLADITSPPQHAVALERALLRLRPLKVRLRERRLPSQLASLEATLRWAMDAAARVVAWHAVLLLRIDVILKQPLPLPAPVARGTRAEQRLLLPFLNRPRTHTRSSPVLAVPPSGRVAVSDVLAFLPRCRVAELLTVLRAAVATRRTVNGSRPLPLDDLERRERTTCLGLMEAGHLHRLCECMRAVHVLLPLLRESNPALEWNELYAFDGRPAKPREEQRWWWRWWRHEVVLFRGEPLRVPTPRTGEFLSCDVTSWRRGESAAAWLGSWVARWRGRGRGDDSL